MFYNLSLESFVPSEHPLRRIRPFVDDRSIRRICRPLYSKIGRPSIPPEQLFLALLGGYLLGIPSERKLVMELQCNMALRWFVGLNLEQNAWDASTFSQNRRRRFDQAGVLEKLFDETVKRAMSAGLVSRHVSADGTLVRANASYKSFVPIELAMDPEEYKRRLREEDEQAKKRGEEPPDPGNRAVNFRGEKRSNETHRSATDPDCRFASKGTSGTGAIPAYTVNALMENRNRILLGINVEIFRSSASETEGCQSLLARAKKRLRYRPKTLGADKGYFSEEMIEYLLEREIEPHIAATDKGRQSAHARVRMRQRGQGYKLSQRCRKLIEELFGEGKEYHGLRRFRRRRQIRVAEEAWMIGWVLNLKRLTKVMNPLPATP
ncbi:transposase [Myxococcota bacterium]|nr:transposase [Myxococcota bacterium]